MINKDARTLLEVRNLTAKVAGVEILKGISLTVRAGEVHAIMGPNGSGKSTFAKALAGHPAYEVTGGTALFDGKDLFTMPAGGARARGSVPRLPVPGRSARCGEQRSSCASPTTRCRARAARTSSTRSSSTTSCASKMKLLEMDPAFLDRSVNEGFSGGEKKRNEILQMALLEPRLAFLDETDSGLDIDALRIVASGVNKLLTADNAVVLVTHYQRLLNYIVPDYVHVMDGGPHRQDRRQGARPRAREPRLRLARQAGRVTR